MPGSGEFRPIDAKAVLAMIKEDPRVKPKLKQIVENAREEAEKRGFVKRGPGGIVVAAEGERCGGCFTCLACGATPTPDLEVACLTTAVYVAD